jgi:quinol monooxygenase YgiN
MTSLTGRAEALFVTPYASNAAIAEDMRREASDTVLAAELARLSRADAEVLDEWRIIQAVARPDLSHGTFPDLAKMRYWEILTFRVRPGHEAEFEAAAKAFGAASDRVAPGRSYRVYQVTAGLPEPTFFVFSSVEAYAQFDEMMASGQKTMQGFTPEEMATMQKFSTDGLINTETNRYALNPTMSYVAAETRATDPAFWMPKRRARRP